MKVKTLVIILIIVFVLFIYNIFCYYVINKSIEEDTKSIILNYLNNSCNNCEFEYEYLRAISGEDNMFSVFIKVKSEDLNEYYRFIFNKNKNNNYQLFSVNEDIPVYIKSN